MADILGSLGKLAEGIGSYGKADSSAGYNQLAQANQESAPGLAIFQRGMAATKAGDEAAQKSALIKQIADKVNNRDYAGATALYAQLDPEGVKTLLPQLIQADPNLQKQLEESKFAAQSGFGNTSRQITDANNAAEMERLKLRMSGEKEADKGKLTDKQDRFAQDMFGKVTSSQDFKNYQEIRQRANSLSEFSKNPSAFGDVANVFAFMKSIDPNSVVRESEFATASEAGGLFTKAQNLISKAEKGERLTDAQRKDLVRISNHMQSVFKKNYDEYMKPVYKQAEKRGISIDLIDPFASDSVASESPKSVKIQGTNIDAVVGQQVRSKSTGKIMTVQPDGSLK